MPGKYHFKKGQTMSQKIIKLAFLILLFPALIIVGEDAQILNPAKVILNPGADYSRSTRLFQGIPSLERSNKGRLWVVWYGGKGTGEDSLNYVTLVTSGDDGASWSDEILVIDPDGDGPMRAFDPELWMDPIGRLWLFWAQDVGHDGSVAGVWTITTNNPDVKNPIWSKPRRLTNGVMMCKPIVLSSSEWVLPVSTWRTTDNSAKMVVSTDHGKTWRIRGACHIPKNVRDFDEHIIVERNDKSLWMLIRTKYGIGESFSTDRGRTWSQVKKSSIKHVTARFFIRRLLSGNLLLVKHGPIEKRIRRSHLTAFISKDDGKTWQGGLLLDERKGVSYPDGIQCTDGTIYLTYDYDRTGAKEIHMTLFSEKDIAEAATGKTVLPPHIIVNKATGLGANVGAGVDNYQLPPLKGLADKNIFIHETEVEIQSAVANADSSEIRYTLDGSEPTQESLLYSSPIMISETTVLKAKEFIISNVYAGRFIKQKPIDAIVLNQSRQGLHFDYFEFEDAINSTADLEKIQAKSEGTISTLTFPYKADQLPEYFGLIFTGFIKIQIEGVYNFSVKSNDGSRLYIANQLVIDNDGWHGSIEKSGQIALKNGFHPLRLLYFQAGGEKMLKIFLQSLGKEKREILSGELVH